MKHVYGRIYGLHDPETGELRYIGQTRMELKRRLQFHCAPSQLKRHDYRTHWILTLKDKGLRPEIRWRADAYGKDELDQLEIDHISRARSTGLSLTNTQSGGSTPSPDHYERLAEIRRGSAHTPEAKAKISAAKKGQPSPMKGKRHSPEIRAKISEAVTGKLTGPKHPQYNHDLTPEAVVSYILENKLTETAAASHFGVSRAFIARRLKEAVDQGLVVPDKNAFRTCWNRGRKHTAEHVAKATLVRTYHTGSDHHMHRDIDLDVVHARLLAGEQQKDVAEELGLSAHTLRRKLKAAGRSVPKRIEIDLEAVRERLAAGERQKDIAKDLGISPSLLCTRLKTARIVL